MTSCESLKLAYLVNALDYKPQTSVNDAEERVSYRLSIHFNPSICNRKLMILEKYVFRQKVSKFSHHHTIIATQNHLMTQVFALC